MTLTIDAPDQGDMQRRNNLARANMIRSWRKDQKQLMSVERAIDQIRDPEANALTWPVGDFLNGVPGIGYSRRERVLHAARVDYTVPLERLTPAQRVSLIAVLRFQTA